LAKSTPSRDSVRQRIASASPRGSRVCGSFDYNGNFNPNLADVACP